jgi:hypothetical protein
MGLTPEDQQYFQDMEETFATQGWKRLVEEARKLIYNIQADALEARSYEQVCEMRGRAGQLAELVNLEELTDLQKQQALAAPELEEAFDATL